MSPLSLRHATLGLVLLAAPSVCAAESSTASITVTAQFSSRTSLKVSSELLQFTVSSPDSTAYATVDFSAAARTRAGGEVVLTVETVKGLEGPGGAADVDVALTFSGAGEGVASGVLARHTPNVAGRWLGSGLRTGRLTFALRSAVTGAYALPVRFVLSAP